MTNNMKNEKCEKPCGTCPFLKKNLGKPNPARLEELKLEQPDFDWNDWYSETNLKRLWNGGVKKGGVMLCHSHDPNASEYGGKDATGEAKICLGSALIAFLHIKYFENFLGNMPLPVARKKYKEKAGKYPMTKDGISEWVMMIGFGRTALMGGLRIPRNIDGDVIAEIGVPWNDAIINGEMQ